MIRKTLFLLLLGFVFHFSGSKVSYAQDIHFTQYYNSPLNLNPALTGFSESRFRFGLQHRNQWSAVTAPFVTYSAFSDFQFAKRRYQGDIWSLGFVVNNDKAGDGEFSTTQVLGSLSYIKSLGNQNRDILGFGIMGGWVQRSIDYNKFTFDEQYNGSYFDPSSLISETFTLDRFSYTDFAAGAQWQHIHNYDLGWKIGLAAWHLTQPNQSMMDAADAKLPIKALSYLEVEVSAGMNYKIYPAFYIARQGTYTELIPSIRFKREFDKGRMDYTALTYGLMYRHLDAVNIVLGYDYRHMSVQLSYDINVSSLRKASGFKGGFELSGSFKYTKDKRRRIKKMECPIF